MYWIILPLKVSAVVRYATDRGGQLNQVQTICTFPTITHGQLWSMIDWRTRSRSSSGVSHIKSSVYTQRSSSFDFSSLACSVLLQNTTHFLHSNVFTIVLIIILFLSESLDNCVSKFVNDVAFSQSAGFEINLPI